MAEKNLTVHVEMSPELRKRLDEVVEKHLERTQRMVQLAYDRGRADVLLELAVTKAPKNDPATKAGARRKAAKSGTALADGSYPIPDARHLFMAMQAFGRCPPEKRGRLVAHIRRRAAALGLSGNERVKRFLADHAGGKAKGS